MTANKTFVYKQIPTGVPVAGEDLVVEDRPIDLTSVPDGGVVLEILYASFDPYLRGKMRDPKIPSYTPAFNLNDAIVNHAVGKVLESKSANFQSGDFVAGMLPIAEYATVPDPAAVKLYKIRNPHNLHLGHFVGALGMPGLTAWSGLYELGKPKKGETIFVSSAAGPVGQAVGQIAKKEGLTVIGSVGSDEKVDFLVKECGFDAAFNYKKEKPKDALPRLAPKGIDIYFENVGGEHLDAALENMNQGGRVPLCGLISEYNSTGDRYGIKNFGNVLFKQITITGFIVFQPHMGPRYAEEHVDKLSAWIADGSVTAKQHITEGIDNASEGFVELFDGKNFGKALLQIKGNL
ncbi:hypothetical protein V8C35DRAFT_295364 [Trichoderma chlorosporum]